MQPTEEVPAVGKFSKSRYFLWLQQGFWIAFVVLPLFTGLLSYRWLPNESYDQRIHDLLDSHDVDDGRDTAVMADVWRNKKTGAVFDRTQFAAHRRGEGRRMAVTWFSYGLIGCFFFAFARQIRTGNSFMRSFRNAVLVNLAVALFTWMSI